MLSYVLHEEPLFGATAAAYAASLALYAAAWRSPLRAFARAATGSLALAAALNAALFASGWLEAGRAPLKSLHETLVFLALVLAAVYLAMEGIHRTRLFGAFACAGALGSLVYAVARWDAEIVRLPPALQSAWFVPHVVVYFVGYGATFFAAVVSAVQLAAVRFPPARRALELRAGSVLSGGPLDLGSVARDAIRFGFVLLTVGMLMGSAWAHGAWGDYWAWDPKETWSLVSWLVYATYLHLQRLPRWRGERAAWLAVAGFAAVAFTYLGMGLLPTAEQSAHVYSE
jgi:cytochrome c-type biogenesis protein CcsB